MFLGQCGCATTETPSQITMRNWEGAGSIGSQNVYYAVNSKKAEIILMIQVTLNENQGNERLKVIK